MNLFLRLHFKISLNCFQVHIPSDEDEMPLGVEAINEDVFDLNDLEEDELDPVEEAFNNSPSSSIASSTFYSTMREVS
jgi:hypothetical protein